MRSLILVLLTAAAFAQVASRLTTGYDSIQASRLKADLTFLSSDALEGRRSLEKGSDVAVQWIASEFDKAGLKPILQPVPLIEYTPDRQAVSLLLNQTQFKPPAAQTNFPNEVHINAPVVFAGFGITAPELNYDDYTGIDAKGKIVMIFNHEPQENNADSVFNGKGNTRYANAFYKVRNAQQHGAVAVLTVPDLNNHQVGGGRGGRGQQASQRPRFHPKRWPKAATRFRPIHFRRPSTISFSTQPEKRRPMCKP